MLRCKCAHSQLFFLYSFGQTELWWHIWFRCFREFIAYRAKLSCIGKENYSFRIWWIKEKQIRLWIKILASILALFKFISLYLLEHLPVVVFLAHHHCLQLLWLEEVHHVHVAHFEKPSLELVKHSLHWFVEDVVHTGSYVFFPIDEKKPFKSIQVLIYSVGNIPASVMACCNYKEGSTAWM